MTEYFKDTDVKAWDVVGFYRCWIHSYKENTSMLDYQKAKDKLIKCLENIATLSPTGNEVSLDPELLLVETEKEYVGSSEHPFDYNEWTLKSGLKVIDLLKIAAEVWSIVRCGLKVAKPKWCEEHGYAEIQKTIKRLSQASIKCADLGKELNKIKIKELMKLNDDLEDVKQLSLISTPPDALASFFVKTLSRFHQLVFPQQSIMQQFGVSEASYGAYMIHPCLIELLAGLEDHFLYEPNIWWVRPPRSTWDGCCKGPLGSMYMLEEIGKRYRNASPKSFANNRVFFEALINTANMIKQLQDEDNDNVSKLSGRLPPHPGKPDKTAQE
ncbi:8227_t:CDS:2, partial [Paraglomus brasilianum]